MSRKAVVLGFGVYYGPGPIDGRWYRGPCGWVRTGSRVVHGIKTYPTLDEALNAMIIDLCGHPERIGTYQIVAEYAFFCRNGDECPECLSHKPVRDVDWSVVQEEVRCGSS